MSTRATSFGVRPASATEIAFGVAITVALHLVLAAAMAFLTQSKEENLEEEIAPKMLEFEEVELLALGVDKPPEQLPRIPNPEKAVKPPDTVELAKPDKPVVTLKNKRKEPEKEDPNARKRKIADALSALHNENRPTNDDTKAGSESGSISGTALNSLLGNYANKLNNELNKYWEIPSTITDEEAKRLAGQVRVYVRLSETGHVVNYKFRKNSDNEQFDSSIKRVLRRFEADGGGRRLPLPEQDDVKNAVISQGLVLKSWEYTGR